jgi:hypothetical protein
MKICKALTNWKIDSSKGNFAICLILETTSNMYNRQNRESLAKIYRTAELYVVKNCMIKIKIVGMHWCVVFDWEENWIATCKE